MVLVLLVVVMVMDAVAGNWYLRVTSWEDG
jgi:hypothetical protein